MASAALLGSHAVSITRYGFDQGLVQGGGRIDLVSSANAAFRPADLAFGMDGALYVSDFCSAIIGHAQHPMRDPHWDHTHGRIWRVVCKDGELPRQWPQIEGRPVAELCELLGHPQDLVREHARIALRKHGAAGLGALDAWILAMRRDSPAFAQAALETLFVWEGLGQTRPALLAELLACDSPMHRAAAVRVMRLQAARIPDLETRVRRALEDAHPRVQMEAVDLVAHERGRSPALEHLVHGMESSNGTVRQMLADLRHGTRPARARSIPVLEVAPECQLRHWEWSAADAPAATAAAAVYVAGEGNAPGDGVYRTVFESSKAQAAILGIKHRFLDVRVNGAQVFSQDSQWSSDQQIACLLQPGLNQIEVVLRKLGKGGVPPVFLFDPVGRPVEGVRMAQSAGELKTRVAEWGHSRAGAQDVVRVQAVPGKMQFDPPVVRVRAGGILKLRFENGDLMQHNLVIVSPGSGEEVGLLADQLAARPEGIARGYVPESPRVLLASPLLNPAQNADMEWKVPREPGRYPFLCTFPGHWRIMRGEIVVE
jgi:azurin